MPLTTRSVLYNERIPVEPWVGQTEGEVREILLPDWLSTEEYCTSFLKWGNFWGLGADPEWPENWQRLLYHWNSASDKLACIQLLRTKKFRSEFRKSLHAQLVKWLTEQRYLYPFSPKQWEKAANKYVIRKASLIEERLNSNPTYYGAPNLLRSAPLIRNS